MSCFIKGVGQPVYFRLRSDYDKSGMADPTMVYLSDVGFYKNIISSIRAGGFDRPPDRVVFNKFNENVVMLFWYSNEDEQLNKIDVEYLDGELPFSESFLNDLRLIGK